jgi:tetratricopeptide (TPR) repeat protein
MKIKIIGSSLLLLLFLGLSPLVFCQENTAENILTQAAEKLARREYTQALELFDTLPPEFAQNSEIRILRAGIYNSAGKPADARKIANEIIGSDKNNVGALMILADAAMLENKERERRQFLENVLKIDTKHARALIDLANINLKNQNLRVAGNYFDRALAAEPNNGEALVGRASVHRYSRELKKAEALLNRAVRLYPDWARPFQERARIYKSAGFNADALEDFAAAIKLEPDNYWVLVDYGNLLMETNQKKEALEFLNRAIKISPSSFIAYVYSAAIKDELGDYEGALKDYTALSKLKPDYYFAFEAIGVIRMRNKQWALARDAFLDAYKQAPKEFNYAILATINWMRAGKQTDPKQFLAQVIKTAPRDSLDRAMLSLFHDLKGDVDVGIKVESEKNIYEKTKHLYYLASYHDIRGNKLIADKYFLMAQELNAVGSLEWRLNGIMLTDRGINVKDK